MSRRALAILLIAAACRTAAPVSGMPVNFGVVEEGKIYRGAQPSAADIEALHRLGVRTILKLNGNALDAERAAARRLDMTLIEVPLNAQTVGTSRACNPVARAYSAMTDPQNWPVYVHCNRGRDRTGFLVGLFRERVESWTFDEVSRELAKYGHDAAMRRVFPNITAALRDQDQACTAPAVAPR